MRIFTDIYVSKERVAYQLHHNLQALNLKNKDAWGFLDFVRAVRFSNSDSGQFKTGSKHQAPTSKLQTSKWSAQPLELGV
jgi:hypothetical protein